MSRAMNLRLPEAYVRSKCDSGGVSISVLEPLSSGGTYLVGTTSKDADKMRRLFARHIIEGPVRRFPFDRE
jgi:hypothetical protein